MKITLIAVLAALGLAGCTAETRSYDGYGNLVGRCEATRSFFIGNADATCSGTSNPEHEGAVPHKGVVANPVPSPSEKCHMDQNGFTYCDKCPDGTVSKYGQCYPIRPIFGAPPPTTQSPK